MNIAHVHTETGWGGGEVQTLYLARGLREAGLDGTLFLRPRGRLFRQAAAAGLPVRELPAGRYGDAATVLFLARELRRGGFDLCHYHTGRAVTFGFLASLGHPGIARVATRRLGYPLARSWPRWTRPWRVPDRVIAVSEFVRRRLLRAGVASGRITVIHSAVDLERFRSCARRPGYGNSRPVVGSIARLDDPEGVARFLNTGARLRRWNHRCRFLLAGAGKPVPFLHRRAEELGLKDCLEVGGFLDDVPHFLARLDCLLFFPPPGAGSPGVLKEAMAAGVPMVAADHPVVREIVTPGGGALYGPADDPDTLAGAARRLLTDPDLAAELVRNARSEVSRFGVPGMVEATRRVYEMVLYERHREAAV